MNKIIEVAEMVGDMYWRPLPDGSQAIADETAVQLVMQHAGVDRAKALGLLLEHSPSRRADRARLVTRVAGLRIAGVLDRDAAMQTLMQETGMSLGWCAAALADAIEQSGWGPHVRRDDGTWTP